MRSHQDREIPLLTLLGAAGTLAILVLIATRCHDLTARIEFYRLFEYVSVNEQGYREYRHRQTDIVMVRVPRGTVLVGASEEEVERLVAALPRDLEGTRKDLVNPYEAKQLQREVAVSPFLIAKYEVTQVEWQRVMGDNPSSFKGDDLPVENVSWEDCKEFAEKTGLSLPTEAQWEYTCRAGSKGSFAGTGKLDDMGWYWDNSWDDKEDNSGRTTHAVGQKRPNSFGLYDMHGNVAEWCEDVFEEKLYLIPQALSSDPVTISRFECRVVRGGSWFDHAQFCRSATRSSFQTSFGGILVGFRPAYYPLP